MKQEGPPWYTSHKLPDPYSLKDVFLYPYYALKCYFIRLEAVFGWKLLSYMAMVQICLKGGAASVTSTAMLPLFKNVFHIEASALQLYMVAIYVPWSIKPLIGLASDFTLIGGYHKRYWLLFAMFLGCLGAILSFVAFSVSNVGWIVSCFTFVMFEIALFDLMTESAYSTVMSKHPYTGSDIVTLTQIFDIIGGVCTTSFTGVLSDAGAYNAMFSIILVLTIVTLPFTWLNWIGEEKEEPSRIIQLVDVQQLRTERNRIFVIALAGISAPFIAVLSNVADPAYATVFAFLLTVGCIFGAFATFPRVVAQLALYQALVTLSRPALGSALDYFYTADEVCLPGGPNFSYAYYQTVVGIVAEFASLVGVLSYQWLLGGMRYRRVVLITSVLRTLAGLSDLILVLRLNIALGIPDKLAYMLGEAMLEPALTMLNYIVGTVLIAKVVIPGMESSIYAFMAGIYNFSTVTNSLSGALLYEAAGVRTIGDCNFNSLWILILVFNIALPLIISIPASFLIPDSYQNESLTINDQTTSMDHMWLEPHSDADEI